MTQLFERLNDGGPVFTYPTFLILLVIIVLTVKGILNKKGDNTKTMSIIGSLGLFTVAWGFAGQMVGIIAAFDTIEAVGDISPTVIASGLKISLLAPLFGLVTFIFARIGIILLTILKK